VARRKTELDGIRDGCPVKLIFKDDGKRKQWFEAPKDFPIDTLHFWEEAGVLRVHQDSADRHQKREMELAYPIASGSYPIGRSFCESKNLDLALLPMQPEANGYRIDDAPSGSIVTMPKDAYCLMAFGQWSPWAPKRATEQAREVKG